LNYFLLRNARSHKQGFVGSLALTDTRETQLRDVTSSQIKKGTGDATCWHLNKSSDVTSSQTKIVHRTFSTVSLRVNLEVAGKAG